LVRRNVCAGVLAVAQLTQPEVALDVERKLVDPSSLGFAASAFLSTDHLPTSKVVVLPGRAPVAVSNSPAIPVFRIEPHSATPFVWLGGQFGGQLHAANPARHSLGLPCGRATRVIS
jgi:hypothetical protein